MLCIFCKNSPITFRMRHVHCIKHTEYNIAYWIGGRWIEMSTGPKFPARLSPQIVLFGPTRPGINNLYYKNLYKNLNFLERGGHKPLIKI